MDKRKFSWISDKLEIKDTGKYGKGVFAKEKISKDEMLIVMGGYIFDIEDENHLNDFNSDKPIEISEDYSICPITEDDMDLMPQHYVNHSCDPNTGFKGSNFMVAMKDIEPGCEILYDYAMIICSNPKSTGYFEMDCECGSERCRKHIDEEGWKNPELQKRYSGYFQWYLEEKIRKINQGN